MTDKQTPPDWVLIEAARRIEYDVLVADYIRYNIYADSRPFRTLCDMIERYEQPPVDRKLLCAREAAAEQADKVFPDGKWRPRFTSGEHDNQDYVVVGQRAIELWEEGYGK